MVNIFLHYLNGISLHARVSWMIIALTTLAVFQSISAFKYHLTDKIEPNKVLTFSERFMFGIGKGPIIMEQGKSFVEIDSTFIAYSKEEGATSFGYAVYAVDDSNKYQRETFELCDGQINVPHPSWAENVAGTVIKATNKGLIDVNDPFLNINGSYYHYEARLRFQYPVEITAWHNVAFKLCDFEGRESDVAARILGDVTFRNPYGFLPGELFGYLPFEGARMIAYVLFGMYFIYNYLRYKASVLPLHHAIVLVYLFALTEATVWYAAYQDINLTGEPYCCPFPTAVVAALVLQVFRQTFARALLLVVSLGYGIVRPKLLTAEWVAVSIVSVMYFVSELIGQVANIIITNDVHTDGSKDVSKYQIPSFIIDVLLITWIYYALGSTIRILTEFQQTAKLKMYTQLAFIIALFVSLFATVAVLLMLDKLAILSWPWQLSWLKEVLWEVLNFAILSAVCIICMPSETSVLLSYASQIPTDDPDEMDGYGPDSMDDDFGDMELTNHGKNRFSFNSLPAAEDDEEYGLKDN